MPRIPVILVTGFLGSGKTTLLRNYARNHPGQRCFFLVNELAEADIDGMALAESGKPSASVVGGSLFCECKAGEFVRMMRESVLPEHGRDPLQGVIIETSGMADPGAIGRLLTTSGLANAFKVVTIISVVAPLRLETLLKNLPVIHAQISVSDTVVINKADTVSSAELQSTEARIREINPDARVIPTCYGKIDLSFTGSRTALPDDPLSSCEANPFSATTFCPPDGLPLVVVQKWLNELPAAILRVKGHIITRQGAFSIDKTTEGVTTLPASYSTMPQLVMITHDDHEALLPGCEKALLGEARPAGSTLPYALIACDVFTEEIDALGGMPPPWECYETLPMGLHDNPDLLRKSIQQRIDHWSDHKSIQAVVLAFGLCGNGVIGLRAGKQPLIIPRGHDCISILLGGPRHHEAVLKSHPGTYFYSPGWVRERRVPGPDREAWMRQHYAATYADDPEMIEELIAADRACFAHHDSAAYVDLTRNAGARDYCRQCAKALNWTFRELKGDVSLLRDLLYGPWDEERFLMVPPGEQILSLHDRRIIQAAP